MRRVGVLAGFAFELRLLGKASQSHAPPLLLAYTGADARRARHEAGRLIDEGAQALLSFGLAGGLDPQCRPGYLIIAERIVLPSGRTVGTDHGWRTRLLSIAVGRNPPAASGAIAGSDQILATAAQKHALAARTGALAVDMESHALAEAAEAAGIPFLSIRAVADPAERTLPRAALAAVNAKGRLRVLAVVGRLLLSPWEGPALLRLRRDAAAALGALEQFARVAGPTLFLVE